MKKWLTNLTNIVKQDFHIDVKETAVWNLPVYSIEVEYETVKRSKMDMLMKMMLIAFKEGKIESTQVMSEWLVVEPIFIEGLLKKMQREKLVEKNHDYYSLTESGMAQVERGIFEHERKQEMIEVLYSPTHQMFLFLVEKTKDAVTIEQELEDYRYLDNFHDFDVASIQKSTLVEAVKKMDVETMEGETQTVVTQVITARLKEIITIPCAEFLLYNEKEDSLYVRVWNEGTNEWDETIEKALNEKERHIWREKYVTEKEKPTKTT